MSARNVQREPGWLLRLVSPALLVRVVCALRARRVEPDVSTYKDTESDAGETRCNKTSSPPQDTVLFSEKLLASGFEPAKHFRLYLYSYRGNVEDEIY